MEKIAIIVAAHKPYWMPKNQAMYIPLQVGAASKPSIGFPRDDRGFHISDKNKTFCELTGQYWAWKNVEAEIYGLCHYRRYFGTCQFWRSKQERILSALSIVTYFKRYDMVLPRKRHYWIETNRSQYEHAHHEIDLSVTQAVLAEQYPEYIPAWHVTMHRTCGHRFNMFLMRRNLFLAYTEWLFSILFAVEKRLDISTYSEKDQRVFGYLAERLLDVWVEHNQVTYAECAVVNLESQYWTHKIIRFIGRKLYAELTVFRRHSLE